MPRVQRLLLLGQQGNKQASKADVERAQREVQRVQLLLRERAVALLQNYMTSRSTAERYRDHRIPRARKAYELYSKSYARRTLKC